MEINYLSPREASKILGVHWQTLRNWSLKKQIDFIKTPGGKRLYNVQKYMEEHGMTNQNKRRICYCRVSTVGQKNDLTRQEEYMKQHYPNHEIYSDIGSGMNYKRKNLLKIIKMAINNQIDEIVVAYKDRLARFGYELIEMLIQSYSKGKIVVLNKSNMSPEEEITKDLVTIINVFSARVNGLRKYKKMIQKA